MKIQEFMPSHIKFEYRGTFYSKIIEFNLTDRMYSGEHHCEITLNSLDGTFNKEVIKKNIQYDEYKSICEKIIEMNFNEIFIKSGMWGLDGSSLEITIGYGNNFLQFHIWAHDYETKKRGLEEIDNIFCTLLKKFDINKELLHEIINEEESISK